MILVTGGAGFIGSHVTDVLVDAGHEVRVLDALLPTAHAGRPSYLNPAVDHVVGDINDPDVLGPSLSGVDVVYHQASMVGLGTDMGDITEYVRHNDAGTAALLHAMHRSGSRARLVLGSSMVVYGEGGFRCPDHGSVRPLPRPVERLEAGAFEPPCPRCGADLIAEAVTEDAPADPRNVYAATKLHQEHLCASFARESGVPLVVLRYHNVYGPRMPQRTPYAGVASLFRSALERGEPPEVYEDGMQRRDFVHVSDIAHANLLALDATPGVYNIASGDPRTVGDMATTLASAFGDITPVVTGSYRLGDVRHVFASIERARRDLRYTPQVAFEDGMKAFARAELRQPAESP